MIRRLALAFVVAAALLVPGTAAAQDPPAATAQAATPPQVQELMRLLQDPVVRGWIEQARPAAPATPVTPAAPPTDARRALSASLAAHVERVRNHLHEIVVVVPQLPRSVANAARMLTEDVRGARLPLILLLGIFVALGFGSERLFRWATARARASIDSRPAGTARRRLTRIGLTLALAVGGIVVFAIGSLGAFVLFEWPPLLRQIVLGFVLAFVFLRLALALLDAALSPNDAGRERILPMTPDRARFWYRRIGFFVGYFAFGWLTVQLMAPLGFSEPGRYVAAYALGLGLFAIALEALWRAPRAEAVADPSEVAESTEGGEAIETPRAAETRRATDGLARKAVLSVILVALWVMWVAGLLGAFWIGIFAFLLPRAFSILDAAMDHLTRPADGEATRSVDEGITRVLIERGLRAMLLVGAVVWLARIWHLDLTELTADTGPTRLARGFLTSVVVILIADLLWHLAKAVIDTKLAQSDTAAPNTNDAVRQARLRTLLPIFRMALLVLIAVMAVLTALSSLGVDVAPLIAGAGVFGVAIGFGSQTLVRDVISGIFYLVDDAFRIGEEIESGKFKGIVESFSLRSVKLRHSDGPLFTVPFGQLGAVQNLSRDWVIDKITLQVTYDADLDEARKIIKKIGEQLAADPEFAAHVIEPLKLQGVERFGDYGIELRAKMKTYPGKQHAIRREAYLRIKQAFDAAGIRFASPTVQVAGGAENAAAAREMLAIKAAAEAPPAAA